MTYFNDDVSLNDESMESRDRYRTLGERTRRFVAVLAEDGAHAKEISYILAYIATEFGLHITENSFRVFPMVLSGITDAGNSAIENERTAEAEHEVSIPDNVIQLQDEIVVH